jgi:uncharacterized protein YkwD
MGGVLFQPTVGRRVRRFSTLPLPSKTFADAPGPAWVPFMKGRPAVVVIMLAGFLAGCANRGIVPAGSTAQTFSVDHYDPLLLSQAIFDETNRVRAAHGVPALEHLRQLDDAADLQSFHMALMFVAEHGNPIAGEANAGERATLAGVTWTRYAENVLMVSAEPSQGAPPAPFTYETFARYLIAVWMGSPPHRSNLLNLTFTSMGSSARFAHSVFGFQDVFASQVFVIRP